MPITEPAPMCAVFACSLHKLVMPGLVPGIHALLAHEKTWMAGSSPAMTMHKG
jgi:hypothetical protein